MPVEKLILRLLRTEDEESLRRAFNGFADSDSDMTFAYSFYQTMTFSNYVEMVNSWRSGENLPENFVPNTYLVGVVEGEIVGRISFRHTLTDFLTRVGGHIGYAVVPSQWNRGYATEMVRQSLAYGRAMGLEKILLTCDTNNLASIRVIEHNGGVYENTTEEPGLTIQKHRYWIHL